MPYEGEFASYRPLHRLAESPTVQSLLRRQRIRQPPSGARPRPRSVTPADVTASQWIPDWVLAIDGSHQPVTVENGFPGAEVGYVTVASVLLDMAKVRQLDSQRPADPQEFRTTQHTESIDSALPGCNVVIDNHLSAIDSLRRALFEVFQGVRMAPDGESLLDTYQALLSHKPSTPRDQHCPYAPDDCQHPEHAFVRGDGEYVCSCPTKLPLYSTDSLRIHEGMQPTGSNGAMFAEIMQVWERIWVLHVLRTLELKAWLTSLRRIAIVLDGPLAVFGHPAWLSHSIHRELARLNEAARSVNAGLDLLLIGIEKTGPFVDHLIQLDLSANGAPGQFPPQTAMLLDDQYIKQNIVFSESHKPYGQDTYFGRKFFYKTASGALLVATLPFFSNDQRDPSSAEPHQFPRLADAMTMLDELVSSRYPNSLAPIVAAHSEAAIPLHLGQRVLERLAHELMAEPIRP